MATYHFSNKPHATLKSGEKMNVKTHYEYICREGKYSHMRDRSDEKLIAVSHGNMPYWSYDEKKNKTDARKFWAEDENQREHNGRGYREIRIALMEEFSYKENIELVETFLKRSKIKDQHAYSYAIHDKTAAFSKSNRNIHAHIMFNEKIIENGRILPADKYFKKYSCKKDGTPIGGYKVSRYYSSKEATIEMRQLWEDIVNAKFREKGMDQRVSCKSLKAQKEEAERRHNYLEASLKDRKSAPQIGSTYRNPRTMEHIQSLVREFTEAMQDPDGENNFNTSVSLLENDEKERNLILFAQDLALRNIAKEIEKKFEKEKEEAKERAYSEIKKKEEEKKIKEIKETDWVITAQDIALYIKEEISASIKNVESLLHKYDNIYIPDMTKEKAAITAMDSVTNGKYSKSKNELQKMETEYSNIEEKEKELIKNKSSNNAEEYSKLLKEKRLLREKIEDKEKEIAETEKYLADPAQEEKLKEIAVRIWNNHLKIKEQKTAALKKLATEQNRQAMLEKHLKEIEKLNQQNVYYYSGNDTTVTRKSKINGETSLNTLRTYVKDGTQYVTIEENKTGDKTKAIRIGDKAVNGFADVYTITTAKDKNDREKIIKTEKTNETIPLSQSYSSIMDIIKNFPEKVSLYKEKLNIIYTAVKEKYESLFKPEGKSAVIENERTNEKDKTLSK